MADFGSSLGLGIGLSGQPQQYGEIAQQNLQFKRTQQEAERKRRQDEIDKFKGEMEKVDVKGLDQAYIPGAKLRTAKLIELMNQKRASNPNGNWTQDSELQKEFNDLKFDLQEKRVASQRLQSEFEKIKSNPDGFVVENPLYQAYKSDPSGKFIDLIKEQQGGNENFNTNLFPERPKEVKAFDPLAFERTYTSPLKPSKTGGYTITPDGRVVSSDASTYANRNQIYQDAFSGPEGKQYSEFLTNDFNKKPTEEQARIIKEAEKAKLPVLNYLAKPRLDKYLEDSKKTSSTAPSKEEYSDEDINGALNNSTSFNINNSVTTKDGTKETLKSFESVSYLPLKKPLNATVTLSDKIVDVDGNTRSTESGANKNVSIGGLSIVPMYKIGGAGARPGTIATVEEVNSLKEKGKNIQDFIEYKVVANAGYGEGDFAPNPNYDPQEEENRYTNPKYILDASGNPKKSTVVKSAIIPIEQVQNTFKQNGIDTKPFVEKANQLNKEIWEIAEMKNIAALEEEKNEKEIPKALKTFEDKFRKELLKKAYNSKTNQTQIIYKDGSTIIVNGKQ